MLRDAALLVLELVLLFFSVAFLVNLSQRRLGTDRLRRWMGGTPVVAALKGIAVGFITPFCTYSAVPMLLGLRRAGVPPAGYVAFIVAAPVLDPVLFGALVLIIGLPAALVYVAVAFGAALGLALTAQAVGVERHMKPLVDAVPLPPPLARDRTCLVGQSDGRPDSCDSEAAWRGVRVEGVEAGVAALGLLRSIGPVLVIGVGIGLVIEAAVPPQLVASLAGSNSALAIPVAAGMGIPLYLNTGLFVPIADSLMAVGVGIGAIVALTIAGAGANIPEFVLLAKLARGRVLTVFAGYVLVVAIVGGLLAQAAI